MRQLTMLFLVCSFLGACASVQQPDADLCGINTKYMHARCYNLKRDFNKDGTRKKNATPIIKPIKDLQELNGWIGVAPADYEKIQVWIGDLRDAYEQEKQRCGQ